MEGVKRFLTSFVWPRSASRKVDSAYVAASGSAFALPAAGVVAASCSNHSAWHFLACSRQRAILENATPHLLPFSSIYAQRHTQAGKESVPL